MQSAATARDPIADPSWAEKATRRVRRYLRCLRCPRDVADDLVQEAMLVALAQWGADEPPLPWLLVTARNLWFAQCRAQRRTVTREWLHELHDRAVRELGDDGGDARVDALRACVASLPERSRLLLQLYYRDGLSRQQVAMRVGLGDEGVKSLLQRLKAALQRCVERRNDDA
jgi:RNA polymerase sigma factor (sigma-70 family)